MVKRTDLYWLTTKQKTKYVAYFMILMSILLFYTLVLSIYTTAYVQLGTNTYHIVSTHLIEKQGISTATDTIIFTLTQFIYFIAPSIIFWKAYKKFFNEIVFHEYQQDFKASILLLLTIGLINFVISFSYWINYVIAAGV